MEELFRLTGLIVRFYKRIALVSVLLSAAVVWSQSVIGYYGILLGFWPKLFSFFLILGYVIFQNDRQFYYYKNLGVDKRTMLVAVGILDMVLYLTMFLLFLSVT